ncbi:S9 family peptidase [Halorubellus sp. JP-L1]|uniref:S9 family peptidase n=1 Tax=Halorubellus sp. JP-L1 TaxID=2715753 RepID=UPI00140E547B|nr:S9 family peptidase [Halorubellus sp. JP-L1]NHN43037.1 S9 family peptidase [Halorubellus sp. JP-L1]
MTEPAGRGDDEGLATATYYDQETVGDVAVSPSGDRVAFTMTEYDGAAEESLTSLFVAPADGHRDPHRLTRASDAGSPSWGPDGERLAFLATRDADPELRAANAKSDDDDEDDGDDTDSDDETSSDDADSDEDDEDEEPSFGEEERQVFVFDLAWGGDARQVTTREHGVTAFDWGPEGERVVIAALDPTEEQAEYLEEREDGGPIEVERTQHKANGFGWTNDARTYLFVVDADSRESERLDEAYASGARSALGGDGMDPHWGSGDRIAFASYQREDADDTWAMDVHTIAPDGTDHRVLTDGTMTGSIAAWHPDGEHLAYAVGDPENNYETADLVVGADDPAATPTVLSGDLELPEWGAFWTGDDALLVPTGDHGQTVLHRVDAVTGDRERVFPAADDDMTSALFANADVAADGSAAAFVLTRADERNVHALDLDALDDTSDDASDDATDASNDAAPVASDRAAADPSTGGPLTRLTDASAAIREQVDLACERLSFESDDGVDVNGFAYRAGDADVDAHDYPVVVDIHGGPTVYDQPWYQFRYHYWASKGYVVLNVNYRGSTSFGHEFAEAISGDWGPREARDVEAGVEHLVDRGWVDPERVFVTGFSQGGINTAFVLAYTDVATAGAAEHGIYDFYSSYGTDDCHVWWDDEFGQPWDDPESYYSLSSVTKVDRIEDPLLLTAGENDWRCPPTQAEQMYVAVKKQGVDAKLVVYPELPHAYGPPETATHRLETVTEWFREHDPAVEATDGDDATNDGNATDDGDATDDAPPGESAD